MSAAAFAWYDLGMAMPDTNAPTMRPETPRAPGKRRKGLPWRSDPTVLERLPKTEALWIRHWTPYQMAKSLGVSEDTINLDIQRIKEQWHDRYAGTQEEIRERVLSELDRIKETATNAASFAERAERAVLFDTTVMVDGVARQVKRDKNGSASYRSQQAQLLAVARGAVMDQAKIMGVVVDKVAQTKADGSEIDLASLVLAARATSNEAVIDAPQVTLLLEEAKG